MLSSSNGTFSIMRECCLLAFPVSHEEFVVAPRAIYNRVVAYLFSKNLQAFQSYCLLLDVKLSSY